MPIVGKAIASYLSKLAGLYSVELPPQLKEEMITIVDTCNENEFNRALLVTDQDSPDIHVARTSWAELLSWRTDDDRIFVWERGNREPDSSFRSVVKPFVSSRFPGSPGGECTLDLLADLSIRQLWTDHGLQQLGNSFEAFCETAKWVARVLYYAFEQVGSTPGSHWSTRFLIHWVNTFDLLDRGLGDLPQPAVMLKPRHAWEMVRVAGLVVPAKIAGTGNPFIEAPKIIEDRDCRELARAWQEIVDDCLLSQEDRDVLLTALDLIESGTEKTCSWRNLDWGIFDESVTTLDVVTAPVVGQKVFTSGKSPNLLSVQLTYPAPKPSWWGVTQATIKTAVEQLQKSTFFRPSDTCTSLRGVAWQPNMYWLLTRAGRVNPIPTSKLWRTAVLVEDIEMVFKAPWTKLTVSHSQPERGGTGHAWIRPDEISLKVSGRKTELDARAKPPSTDPTGTQLLLKFDLEIKYVARHDQVPGKVSGNWNPVRTLQIEAKIRDFADGSWRSTARSVNASVDLIIPSPFSPTVLMEPRRGKPAIAPGGRDDFEATLNTGEIWEAENTPDILLKEEGIYTVSVYDGSLDPDNLYFLKQTTPLVNGVALEHSEDIPDLYSSKEVGLDDSDVLSVDRPSGSQDFAVVKIRERSASLSSGLLSAVRGIPTGQKPPSTEAKNSLPGQYQVEVAKALCQPVSDKYNSLYQYVVFTGESPFAWPEHPGTSAPKFLPEPRDDLLLPGVGNGPSINLVSTPQWSKFMHMLSKVSGAVGLKPGAEDTWLSGFNPCNISGLVVKSYVEAHRDLVRAAKQISLADAFWASYPFSVVIVEGRIGPAHGQVQAVLLSLLHPARLAWSFAVAFTAKSISSKGKSAGVPIGLAEGWSIPYTGVAVSVAGEKLPLVAIPTDPGLEQDFVSWSALVALDNNGLAQLPALAAGFTLPWGGQTGINDKVVAQALRDYLEVHHHLSSLEVDIRSVSKAPRSKEIDEAVLRLVGGESEIDAVKNLGGGTRVWDSFYRLGQAPTRDDLAAVRGEITSKRPFEWRRYQPQDPPSNSDVAFVENSNVQLFIREGTVSGLVGLLPLKRFSPSTLKDLSLKQNYSTTPGEDLLGLASLLAEIEYSEEDCCFALEAYPRPNALGIGQGGRWEILGTFNIDPALLSAIVAEQAQSAGKRLLWEWRPSWLSHSKPDIARRPYYVVGKIPVSLLKALESRQHFTGTQPFEMLSELGRRGIGLNSLQAAGGTQESAAAGFFYSLRLLLPPPQHPLPAKWLSKQDDAGTIICGLIPMDPIVSILAEIADQPLAHWSDLLAIRIGQEKEVPHICFVPVEIKHHGSEAHPEPVSEIPQSELRRARQQLFETAAAIGNIAKSIRPEPSNAESFLACYSRLLGLATLLELAMSFTPTPPLAAERARILKDVLVGNVSIGVGNPVLLWFAPGTMPESGRACIRSPFGLIEEGNQTIQEVILDPAAVRGLWWNDHNISPNETDTRKLFDDVMQDALSACVCCDDELGFDIREGLSELLGLDASIPSSNRQADTSPSEKVSKVSQEEAEATDTAIRSIESPIPDTTDEVSGLTHVPPLSPVTQAPEVLVGWNELTTRWAIIGKISGTNETVALDLDQPKTIGIFGYMGSGKSYLLGDIVEAALEPIPRINRLTAPLAVVVFNYRRNATDRFELSSFALPNQKTSDIERLSTEYGALPQPVRDIHILCLPGEMTAARQEEYAGLPVSDLFFNPATLTAEDWELLMGEPGSNAVFARTVRHALRVSRSSGEITLEDLEHRVSGMLKGQSRTAAQLRFEFVRQFLSKQRGVDFRQLLRPGRAVILDLRQPLFNKSDALRFFLVCSSYVSRVQGQFNKLVVFDEAHEYLSDEFGERIEARIRLMRHEGTSYIFATQDVGSIPSAIRRFITTRFVFDLGTRENIEDLLRFAPEFEGNDLQGIDVGHCLVQANQSVRGIFGRPRMVHIRPRVTQHGGATRIFSASLPAEPEDGK